MAYKVGDRVVYPHHGAMIIKDKGMRKVPVRLDENDPAFKDEGKKMKFIDVECFVLGTPADEATSYTVPVDNTESVGVRDIIGTDEVEEVFAVLGKKDARTPTNWSRRYKNHLEKLKSGDVYQVAEVIRNLSVRDADKGLSAGEKSMLAKARRVLVSELVFAINVSEEEAEKKINEALP